jgi:hypothetical protein
MIHFTVFSSVPHYLVAAAGVSDSRTGCPATLGKGACMSNLTRTPRNTGGFSLDDAARIVRSSLDNLPALCPTCGAPLRRVVGEEHSDDVWLLRCTECGRGMVFRRAGSVPRRRTRGT